MHKQQGVGDLHGRDERLHVSGRVGLRGVILSLVIALSVGAADRPEMTAANVVQLVQAQRAKYQTFRTDAERKAFHKTAGRPDVNAYMTTTVQWRTDGATQYAIERRVEQQPSGDFPPPTVTQFLLGPKWSKRLIRFPDTTTGAGTIQQPGVYDRTKDATMADDLWGLLGQSWDAFAAADIKVVPENGLLRLETTADGAYSTTSSVIAPP